MNETSNLVFIRAAGAATVSGVYENERYDLAVIQVTGDADAFEVTLEGRVDRAAEWEPLASLNLSDLGSPYTSMTEDGIYEFGIGGVSQIRARVHFVTNGAVTVSGVLWNGADNSRFPRDAEGGKSLTFGDAQLFVKGAAEVIYTDPKSGAICGYEKVLSDAAIHSSVNLAEITAGLGNRLINVIPDTARITGTYTNEAFSLRTRALIMGGTVAYDAVSRFCEKIRAESSVLTLTRQPCLSPEQESGESVCRCYVREVGAGAWRGENYGADPVSWQVLDFTAIPGRTYEITYFIHNPSAVRLPVPTEWNPVMMTVTVRYGVYRRQGTRDSEGAFYGRLSFVVPLAVLTGDAGVNGSQTAHGVTSGSWEAIPAGRENMPSCCDRSNSSAIAYYVFAPCGDGTEGIADIVLPGGGLTLKAGQKARLPLKFVMEDGTLTQPDYSLISYLSSDGSVASVDGDGMVTGVSAGTAQITAYVTKKGGAAKTVCSVQVTGTAAPVRQNRSHILAGG